MGGAMAPASTGRPARGTLVPTVPTDAAELKDREIARAIEHQANLKKEQDEVLRLKAELEKA